MTKERMYYGVYAVIDLNHQQQLIDLIQNHKGKDFGQDKTILGIFGKAYYASQTALLFLQDCLKEPTCTYSVLVLKGTQTSLVKDAKQLVRDLPPGCCMITQAALDGLQEHDPVTESAGSFITSSGKQATLYILKGCGDILLDDEAASSLFDFSGVEPDKPQSDEHTPTPPLVDTPPTQEPQELQESVSQSNEMLEVASTNQIYSPPDLQQVPEDDESATEYDSEATEPPFVPSSIPSIKIDTQNFDVPSSNVPHTNIPLTNVPPHSEGSSEFRPSPTVTQGYAMPHFPDPWQVRWRKDPVLFWGSIIASVFLVLVLLWAVIPKRAAPQPTLSIEEEERVLFDEPPLYAENEQQPTYQTMLTAKEAKSKVLDLEKTTFPQIPGPNTAFMEIISKPEGASVTINGETLSEKTPLTTFLVHANTKMTVEVRKPGHIEAVRDVTIEEQQRRGLLFILTQE